MQRVLSNSQAILRFLALGAVGILFMGCATRPADLTLPVGARQLLAPAGSAQSLAWRSSRPDVVAIQLIPDSRGISQSFLLALQPGSAWITAGPTGGRRTVGPTEVILNQSARNSRLALPPERPIRLRIVVE